MLSTLLTSYLNPAVKGNASVTNEYSSIHWHKGWVSALKDLVVFISILLRCSFSTFGKRERKKQIRNVPVLVPKQPILSYSSGAHWFVYSSSKISADTCSERGRQSWSPNWRWCRGEGCMYLTTLTARSGHSSLAVALPGVGVARLSPTGRTVTFCNTRKGRLWTDVVVSALTGRMFNPCCSLFLS